MSSKARIWLDRIRALPLAEKIKIMNVCGGHERTISMAGLRGALPENIELVPGPGCPVCVCPEEDVFTAIQLAVKEDVILLAFGDMLRVPVNVPRQEISSLQEARAAGADVRAIASPLDAVRIARDNRDRTVAFFAAGFETTIAPVAAMLVEGTPGNLQVLLAGRLTWPAVALLLSSDIPGFAALIAPGHVATVMGAEQWQFVVQQHNIATAIAGFSAESLLAAIYSVLRQKLEGKVFLDNCYTEVVKPQGNDTARQMLAQAMQVVAANWRGIGIIPASGFTLSPAFADHDARLRFPACETKARQRAGQMPPGCDCARVVLGKIYPNECVLYGRACTPKKPIGPCMVSDEGACRIWWSTGIREAAATQKIA